MPDVEPHDPKARIRLSDTEETRRRTELIESSKKLSDLWDTDLQEIKQAYPIRELLSHTTNYLAQELKAGLSRFSEDNREDNRKSEYLEVLPHLQSAATAGYLYEQGMLLFGTHQTYEHQPPETRSILSDAGEAVKYALHKVHPAISNGPDYIRKMELIDKYFQGPKSPSSNMG